MYEDVRLNSPPVRAAERKAAYGQRLKFATLNCRSIQKAGMHPQVERYMEERNIAIMCLQETKVAHTTQYVVGDLTYALHGHGRDQVEHAGVGFVIRPDIRPLITGLELDEEGIIMLMGIDLAPRRLTLITAYMPQSNRPDLERAETYERLEKIVTRAANKGRS